MACIPSAISTVYGTTTVFQSSTELLPTTYVAVNPNLVYTAFRTGGKEGTFFYVFLYIQENLYIYNSEEEKIKENNDFFFILN